MCVVDQAKLEAAYRAGYDNALAEQPFDRAAIIEECAKVVEAEASFPYPDWKLVAAAIRALKDK